MRTYLLLLTTLAFHFAAVAQTTSSGWLDQVRSVESSTWTVEVVGEKRTRRLRLGRAADPISEGGRIEAWYGWSDREQVPVVASIRNLDGSLTVKVITPAKSSLEVSPTGQSTLEGTFVPKDGSLRDARLTRLDVSVAQSPLTLASTNVPKPLHSVHMIYMGADDCPPCRWWLASDLERLRKDPTFRQIKFNHVIKSIKSSVPPLGFLPEDVRPLKPQLDEASAGSAGSAQVALFVDGRLFDYYFGTRTADEVLAMLNAINTGTSYPFPRCLQVAYPWRCTRRPS